MEVWMLLIVAVPMVMWALGKCLEPLMAAVTDEEREDAREFIDGHLEERAALQECAWMRRRGISGPGEKEAS